MFYCNAFVFQKNIYGLDRMRLSPSRETQRVIEIVRMSKTNTLAVQKVSTDEIIWYPILRFLEQLPPFYQPLLFYGKNRPCLFLGILWKPKPSRPFIKDGSSNYVNRVKNSKKNNAILNFFHFKSLEAPHKMIAKSIKAQNPLVYNV